MRTRRLGRLLSVEVSEHSSPQGWPYPEPGGLGRGVEASHWPGLPRIGRK